jgi:hypothetical protein
MLITNFAAGELAETLFGRVDMAQYYSGVSHMENFDVIPTGGISRRHGMKRIRQMEGDGRIIPFILNRDASFLLFLRPGKIQVFRGGELLNTVTSSSAVPLYASMDEIHEVQYAQDYNKMVMVHENYAPIQVIFTGQSLQCSLFQIEISIKNISSENKYGEYSPETDVIYRSRGYLQKENNYPKSVTFFNGRIVFAGTKNNPQRIFISAADNIYNFSTYKKYITEKRQYVTVTGKIRYDSEFFELEDPTQAMKFIGNIMDYICDSQFYPKGTRIINITDVTLKLSNKSTSPSVLTPSEKNDLDAWKAAVVNLDNNPKTINLGPTIDHSSGMTYNPKYRVKIYTTKVIVEQYDLNPKTRTLLVTNEDALGIDGYPWNANPWYSPFIRDRIIPTIQNLIDEEWDNYSLATWENESYRGDYQDLVYWLSEYIGINMVRNFRGVQYVGSPDYIYQTIITKFIEDGTLVFMPLYTEELLIDRYPTPDDGFTFEIASDMSDGIKWIAQNKNLLIGTETGEWVVPAGVNATNVQAVLNGRYGSDRIQATTIGDAMCFFQSGKKSLVEYYIPQQDNNFRANNMAMLSKNMLHESPAFDFDFISAPYTKIFVSREDGTVVCLLYERSTGTFAWGRMTTRGLIKSVAAVPGLSGYDDVYLIVKRGDGYFLERHSERVRGGQGGEEAVYLDCYKAWDKDRQGYSGDAVVYDETDNKIYPTNQLPIPGHAMWIGYPYESRVRSMPVLANDRMKQNNIKNLYIRFNDSFMPKLRSVSIEEGKERMGNTDTIGRPEPYSGVVQVPFPGVWDRDVFFELIHDRPTRCRVLAVNAEAN